MMLKDLRLAMDTAKSAGADVEIGALAEQLYTRFNETGGESLDFSGIIRMIRGELK
jgi:3-hydroxyisobutyrate dehydrogenase